MSMSYTEQMEEALWQRWSDYDTDAEYASTIDFLNAEDGFRTFGEGLVALMQKKDPSMDTEKTIALLTAYCKKNGVEFVETRSLEESMPKLDILYMTRVQRERFFNEEDYLRLKDSYILTPDKLDTAKADLAILHPLPRVNEISVAIDDDPRACYFKQVLGGKLMRMALILKLLKEAQEGKQMAAIDTVEDSRLVCDNPRCISSVEQELPHKFKLVDAENGIYRCVYCEVL